MNDFLNQVYLDNTVLSYLIVAVTILFVFLFKKFIANYAGEFFYYILKQRYKNLDKNEFKNLVAKPLGLFIAVLVTLIALDKLHFPSQWDIRIYHLKLQEIFRMAGSALLIITFFRFLIKSVDFITLLVKERYMQDGTQGHHQLVFFFKDFIKVVIGIIGLMILLKYTFHYDIKGLVTGLSIVGAAIALALKESLENLIASFIIFFDKPFETGDAVKVNNVSGTVERIGLRSTRIRTDAKTYVTMPNKQMVDSVLDNLSNRTLRRADLKLEIGVDTPPEKANTLVEGIRKIMSVPEIKNFNVYLNDIIPGSLVVLSDYYTEPNNLTLFNTVRQKVNLEVLQLVDGLDIDITGKTTDIKIVESPARDDPK